MNSFFVVLLLSSTFKGVSALDIMGGNRHLGGVCAHVGGLSHSWSFHHPEFFLVSFSFLFFKKYFHIFLLYNFSSIFIFIFLLHFLINLNFYMFCCFLLLFWTFCGFLFFLFSSSSQFFASFLHHLSLFFHQVRVWPLSPQFVSFPNN